MKCNVNVFYKMIFSNKFGFILETSLFLYIFSVTPSTIQLNVNNGGKSLVVEHFCSNNILTTFGQTAIG